MSATNEILREHDRFASARQRLETASRRGVEFRPVKLFLQAPKDFVTDLALCTQPVQRLALGGDRTQPQIVVLGRSLRFVGNLTLAAFYGPRSL